MWFNDAPSLKTPQRLPVSEMFALAVEECHWRRHKLQNVSGCDRISSHLASM